MGVDYLIKPGQQATESLTVLETKLRKFPDMYAIPPEPMGRNIG